MVYEEGAVHTDTIETLLLKVLPEQYHELAYRLTALVYALRVGFMSVEQAQEQLADSRYLDIWNLLNGLDTTFQGGGHISVGDISQSQAVAIGHGSVALCVNVQGGQLPIKLSLNSLSAEEIMQQSRLLLCPSAGLDIRTITFPLTCSETKIGRPARDEQGSNWVDISSFFPASQPRVVSKRHARIRKMGDSYQLENWEGRGGIDCEKNVLHPGQAVQLTHGTRFSLPAHQDSYFNLLFLEQGRTVDEMIVVPSSYVRDVYIFGKQIELSEPEYRLFTFLKKNRGRNVDYSELTTQLGWKGAFRREQINETLLRMGDTLRQMKGFSLINLPEAGVVRFVV